MRYKPHGGDIKVREVIGTEDIRVLSVQRLFVADFRPVKKHKEEKGPRPDPVEGRGHLFQWLHKHGQ